MKMVTKAAIDDFLSQRNIAVAGVSKTSMKFGNSVFKHLKKLGYNVIPVNNHLETYNNQICYPNLSSIPVKPDSVVIVLKPANTDSVIREAATLGIKHIWIQQGAESKDSAKICEKYDINCIYGYCIFMFAEPKEFVHRLHRWFMKVFKKLPD